jgi:predicted nucleotidyltransferase
MIDLAPAHMAEIKRILAEHVPDCEVFAFGSRVNGKAWTHSDLDIALMGNARLDWRHVEKLKDAFSESDLPVIVDVLDWHTLSDEFRRVIMTNHETIQQAPAIDKSGRGRLEDIGYGG